MPETPKTPGDSVTLTDGRDLPATSAGKYLATLQTDPNTYYPGAKVRLAIRFENFSKKITDDRPPPRPLKNLVGIKDSRAPLKVTSKPLEGGGTQLELEFDGAKKPLAGMDPQLWTNSADGFTHVLSGVVPRSANWVQNGIRQADTLSLTLNYLDCPIDPRTMRSCAVAFYLGTHTPDTYAAGIGGDTRTEAPEGRFVWEGKGIIPMNQIPDSYIDPAGRERTNLRFQGWIDKWDVDWSGAEPLIHIECRDNTQMLIDQEAPARLVINTGVDIDEAIATYLSHFPQFGGLTIEFRPKTEKGKKPQLKQALDKTAYAPMHLGVAPGAIGNGASNLSVWDYLTDICGALALSIRMEGTNLVIQEVRTYAVGKDVRRKDDPLMEREGKFYRRFIYGRNILELHQSRSFVRNIPTNIEVRSYSTKNKRVYVGRFPSMPRAKSSDVRVSSTETTVPGEFGPDEKWLEYRVSGITDEKFLRTIARQIYESLGRQELSCKLRTRDLASFGGGNLDPDILDMKPGDTIEVIVNKRPEDNNELTRIEEYLLAQNQAFLKSRGFSERFLAAYSEAYSSAAFQVAFRTKTVGVGWDVSTGVTIDIECVNYVEVLSDKYEPHEVQETKDGVDKS